MKLKDAIFFTLAIRMVDVERRFKQEPTRENEKELGLIYKQIMNYE